MNINIVKLEKIIKEQAKQIDSLKKAMLNLQNRLIQMSKKVNRTYQSARKNTNDINNIKGVLDNIIKR